MKIQLLILLATLSVISVYSQTLYVPNGTNGIGTSTNAGKVGVGTATPQQVFEVSLPVNSLSSFAGNIQGGQYAGIHFGYMQTGNALYRKSALVFERNDNAARGKIHLLNNGDFNSNSATLNDARLTIDYDGKIGIGTTTPQKTLDVVTPINSFSSFGNIIQIGESSGIHFGFMNTTNANNRKSALMFERLDDAARGKIHIVNNGDFNSNSATLTDARITIDYDGKVGIGTRTPQKNFEVSSPINNYSSFGGNIQGGEYTGIHFGYMSAVNSLYRKSALVFERIDNAARGKIHILNNGDFNSNSATLSDAKLTINYDGKIGIGVTDPVAKLDVKDGNQRINFLTGTSSSGYTLNIGVNDDGINFINDSQVRGFNFKNALGDLVTIKSNGNLLLGKASQINPDYKLDVEGKIRANEIVVNTTGADFVFEEAYDLKSLEDVETFIKINKHLPEIPSATEMKQNGLELGEVQIKLLQKIEELTLYLIQQNKIMHEQGEEMKNLKKEIEQLKLKQ